MFIMNKYQIPKGLLTFESRYFLAVATVEAGDLSIQTFAILQRYHERNQVGKESDKWHSKLLTQSINTP
jgi:hypothetical protein